MEEKTGFLIMPNTLYDVLTWIGQIVIPALGVLYATLAETWGLPYGDQILKTTAAITVFANAILKYARAKYKKTMSNENVS